MKVVARFCFAGSLAFFGAAIVLDRGAAGMAAMIGLALQSLGLMIMTLR